MIGTDSGPTFEEQSYHAPTTETGEENDAHYEQTGFVDGRILVLAYMAIMLEVAHQQSESLRAFGAPLGSEGFTAFTTNSLNFDHFGKGAPSARQENINQVASDLFAKARANRGRAARQSSVFNEAMRGFNPNGVASHFNAAGMPPTRETAAPVKRNPADYAPLPFGLQQFSQNNPSPEDVKGRQEASAILREGLKAQGWDGGEVTADMRKAALREGIKRVHTDVTGENGNQVSGSAARFITQEFTQAKNEEKKARQQADYQEAA